MLYVIGDTHGCFNELMQLMQKIEKIDNDAEYILIGDIYDRGKEIVPLCEWAIKNINNIDGRYKMVMGNHEWDAINIYNEFQNVEDHKDDWNTFKTSISDYYGSLNQIDDVGTYIKIMEFFKTLPFYFDVMRNGTRYIIIHADVPRDIVDDDGFTVTPDEWSMEDKEYAVWHRNYWGLYKPQNIIVVHGHTPTLSHDYSIRHPDIEEGRVGLTLWRQQVNIDCGCVYHHFGEYRANLAAFCLDSQEVIYLYSDEELEQFRDEAFKEFNQSSISSLLQLIK